MAITKELIKEIEDGILNSAFADIYKDPEMAEKIQYSMEVDMSDPKRDRRKLVGYKNVDPQVPIFIVYYTLFPVPEGDIKSFPDIYGYDSIIAKALRSI